MSQPQQQRKVQVVKRRLRMEKNKRPKIEEMVELAKLDNGEDVYGTYEEEKSMQIRMIHVL